MLDELNDKRRQILGTCMGQQGFGAQQPPCTVGGKKKIPTKQRKNRDLQKNDKGGLGREGQGTGEIWR